MRVIVWCDTCGRIAIRPDQVHLALFPSGATYSFQCPHCETRSVRDASPEAVELLTEAEVVAHPIVLPPQPRSWAPPLTEHDVSMFRVALHVTDDPIEELK